MSKKYLKIIKKWGNLRHSDPKFTNIAIKLYEHSNKKDQEMMLNEFTNYIDGVKKGDIIPSTPTIPIRVFKNGRS